MPTATNKQVISAMYAAVFNRAPDAAGLAFWEAQFTANSANAFRALAAGFTSHPVFSETYGAMNDSTFVQAIYQNVLGGPGDAGGVQYWNNQLGNGVTRSEMLASFVEGALTIDLAALKAAGQLTAAEFTAASARQNQLTNKANVGLQFAELLGANSNLAATTDTTTVAGLNADPIYRASVAAISSVTSDPATVASAVAALQAVADAVAAGTVTDVASTLGQSFSLTTGGDTLAGTAGNDTFNATYDGGIATDTLGAGDSVDGLGGIDTLKIDHLIDVAITPPDTLWTGLSHIEKIVINTTGDGAQTLTTGANFQAAFAAGVTLTTTTSGAGAITLDLSTFTGEAVLNTTSIAGAQTIVTGSGLTAVTATSDAGALDIKGTGLALVSATTTGGGAQTIGDAGGNGASLTVVNATANSGTQTITGTNTADTAVTASSTSGEQHISTGAGNDTVITTAAAGTVNTLSTGAGNDTIVASLGNDLITGGLGADNMTGGGGIDTFAFGADGSIIGVSMDSITDFNVGGADILTFGATTTVLAVDATALVAGANVQTSAGGLISFHADDSTLALKTAAVQADIELDVAGSVGMFVDGGNTYVYYAGTAAGNADDQLIQLSGITTLATLTGGLTVTIA